MIFKKLLSKRIDAAVLQISAGEYVLKNTPEFSKNIIRVEKPIEEKPYYLIFSKDFVNKYPELTKKIWNEIEKVRESKEFEIKKNDFFKNYKK